MMSDTPIEEDYKSVEQKVVFQSSESGEEITTFSKAAGVEIPGPGDTITLSKVEFEEPDSLSEDIAKNQEEFVVTDIQQNFAQLVQTESDSPEIYQFSVVVVSVEGANTDGE